MQTAILCATPGLFSNPHVIIRVCGKVCFKQLLHQLMGKYLPSAIQVAHRHQRLIKKDEASTSTILARTRLPWPGLAWWVSKWRRDGVLTRRPPGVLKCALLRNFVRLVSALRVFYPPLLLLLLWSFFYYYLTSNARTGLFLHEHGKFVQASFLWQSQSDS